MGYFDEQLKEILEVDDKESFLDLLEQYPGGIDMNFVTLCGFHRAKKCLIALVNGEVCEPPLAIEGCATCIHRVVWAFPDLDVVNIMFMRGAFKDLNIKYELGNVLRGTPLQILLNTLSAGDYIPLGTWVEGDSIYKLITLLCMCEMKQNLEIARKLAWYTESVNDIAWFFLENGKLVPLAALLLVAQKKVFVPFETGMTIQQRLTNKIDELSSEVCLDDERDRYKSVLLDVRKLFDAFERAGDDLSAYSTALHKYVSPKKVVVDVVSLLKKAGLVLQNADLDFRDCYRTEFNFSSNIGWTGENLELWKANLFELSDSQKVNNSPDTDVPHFDTYGYICSRHWDPLIGWLKTGEVIQLADAFISGRRWASSSPAKTGEVTQLAEAIRGRRWALSRPAKTGEVTQLAEAIRGRRWASSCPAKHLAYVAMNLRRRIRF